MRRARRLDGEEGVALALALAFLSLFGVFSGVLLGFSETGVRTTQAVRAEDQKMFLMEGAIDTAIAAMRDDLYAGRDPSTSPLAYCNPHTATGGGQTVTATCAAEPGSGAGTGGSGVPDHAILALSTDPNEHGIEQVSDVSIQVSGSIFSNSNILNSGVAAIMTVQGPVEAIGDCVSTHPTAQIISTQGALKCANTGGGADPARGADPDYEPAVSAAPPWRPVPACVPGSVITLVPGTYDDAAALSALTDGSCSQAVVHLTPAANGVGVYHFDFRNSGNHEWVISDPSVNVVAGTAKGWVDLGISRPVVPFPGGCKLFEDPAPNHGVQLVFGNDSRMKVLDGAVELCPQPVATGQRISVYGLSSGSATSKTHSAAPAAHAAVTNVTSPENGYAIEGAGAPAHATFATTLLSPLAQATYSGTLPIPDGSTITSVKLRLAQDGSGVPTPATTTTSVKVVLSSLGSATLDVAESPGYENAYVADPGGALSALTGSVGGDRSFSITPSVTSVGTADTWNLDGLALEITYEEPSFRAQAGCIVDTYRHGVSGCPVLLAEGVARMAIQGSVYAPAAPVDVSLVDVSTQIFNRGIIARAVRFGVTPVDGFTGATVGVSRQDRVVAFTAVAGSKTLKARATFHDGGGITPGQTVTIDRWRLIR